MNAVFYSALASASAVACEAYYRSHAGEGWGPALWPGLILAMTTNFGIWGILQTESVLGLAVLFSAFTAGLRIAYTLASGDPVAPGVWVAFGLLLVAIMVKGVWK